FERARSGRVSGDDAPALALRALVALGPVLKAALPSDRALELCNAALAIAPRAGMDHEFARALVIRAKTLQLMGRLDDSAVDVERALNLAPKVDSRVVAEALEVRFGIAYYAGDADRAHADCEHAIEICRAGGDRASEAKCQLLAAQLHRQQGRG